MFGVGGKFIDPYASYDRDAVAHYIRLDTPLPGQLTALSTMIKDLKAGGWWTTMTALGVPAGSIHDSMLNIRDDSFDAVYTGTPTFTSGGALRVGNGTGMAWDATFKTVIPDTSDGSMYLHPVSTLTMNSSSQVLLGTQDTHRGDWNGITNNGSSFQGQWANDGTLLTQSGTILYSSGIVGLKGNDPTFGSQMRTSFSWAATFNFISNSGSWSENKTGIVGEVTSAGIGKIPTGNVDMDFWFAQGKYLNSGSESAIFYIIRAYLSTMGITA